MTAEPPIVFFDGTCGFCSRTVRWILRHDRRGEIRFAPIQGQTYAELDADDKPMDLSTMVVWKEGELFTRSSAGVRTLWALGGLWGVLGWLIWLIPKPIRDAGYRVIAANRYRIAGRRSGDADVACELPSDADRARLLP